MSKKVFVLLILMCIAIALMACGADDTRSQIALAEMTDEQRDLLNLVTFHNQQIMIFEFSTIEPFSEIELWVDIYEYGERRERGAGFSMLGVDRLLDGQIAASVIENREAGSFDWHLRIREGSSSAGQFSQIFIDSDGAIGRAFGSIQEPIEIEDGREIILYSMIFDSGGGIGFFGDLQIYVDAPELLEQYPIVYLLKIRFTK